MSTSQDPNSPEIPDCSSTCKQDLQVPSKDDPVAWLHVKLAEAEQSVRARLGMVEGFQRRNDPKFWEELKKLPGVFTTRSRQKAPTEAELQKEEASQRRILQKCEREVAMFKALIALVAPTVTPPKFDIDKATCLRLADMEGDNSVEAGILHPDVCTSPRIITADGKEWWVHVPGDPMPCEKTMMVEVRLSTRRIQPRPSVANSFCWGDGDYPHIIAWRPADAPDILPRQGGAECL